MKKKLLALLLLSGIISANIVFADDIQNVQTSMSETPKNEYRLTTVNKHYKVYTLDITNNNNTPILLSADSEILFVSDNKTTVKSDSRRTSYRKVRKRDIGRYWWIAAPGALISGAITGFTLFLGAPVAAAVYVGAYMPADKAVRTNTKISQDLFNTNALPIRIEPNKKYTVRIFVPKKTAVKEVIITNLIFNDKEDYNLKIINGEL